jgi:hypothetical protein
MLIRYLGFCERVLKVAEKVKFSVFEREFKNIFLAIS